MASDLEWCPHCRMDLVGDDQRDTSITRREKDHPELVPSQAPDMIARIQGANQAYTLDALPNAWLLGIGRRVMDRLAAEFGCRD